MELTSLRIVTIDDSEDDLNQVTSSLAKMGLKNVQAFLDSKEACNLLTAVAGTPKAPDLILCDWNMPIFTGADVLKLVRGIKPLSNVKFFFITSRNEFNDVMTALSDGADNFLVKPVEEPILKRKILEAFKISS